MEQQVEIRVHFKVLDKWYDKDKRSSRVLIECECGNIVEKGFNHVTSGCLTCGNNCPIGLKIKSLRHKNIPKPSLMSPPGEVGFNCLYEMYKRRSKKYNREFSLTKEQFKDLTQSDCYYCGAKPSMVYNNKEKNIGDIAKENGKYIYNSIDRIDSTIGYTLENSRPCCKMCNTMKLDHSEAAFAEHIRKLYESFAKHYG